MVSLFAACTGRCDGITQMQIQARGYATVSYRSLLHAGRLKGAVRSEDRPGWKNYTGLLSGTLPAKAAHCPDLAAVPHPQENPKLCSAMTRQGACAKIL
jgi:hypothetical protein